jgi:hypothetical protein
MLDRAKSGLAEPFRGIATNGGEIIPGPFAINKTGVSLAPAARGRAVVPLWPDRGTAEAGYIRDRRRSLAEMVEHSPLADAPWHLPHRFRRPSARGRPRSNAGNHERRLVLIRPGHHAAHTRQGLLGPTAPTFWTSNPAYAQVQNEHVWQTAWAEIMKDGATPQAAAEKAFKRVGEVFSKYPIPQG